MGKKTKDILITGIDKIKWGAKSNYGTLKVIKVNGRKVHLSDLVEDGIWKYRIKNKDSIFIGPFSDETIRLKSVFNQTKRLHIDNSFPPKSKATRMLAKIVGNSMWNTIKKDLELFF